MRLILTLVLICLVLGAALPRQPFQAPAYQRPLLAYLDKVAPGSSVQVLQTAPLHLLVTIHPGRSNSAATPGAGPALLAQGISGR